MISRQILSAMTAAWVHEMPGAQAFLIAMGEEKLGKALQATEEAQASAKNPLHAAIWAQVAGDVALLAGDSHEAQTAYGKSLQHASGQFAIFLSGRAAARRALCGEEISPAAYRFWQLPAGPDEWSGQFERIAGRALMFHCSALTDAAALDASRLSDAAETAQSIPWKDIAATIQYEFSVLDSLHHCEELADHVYWHRSDRQDSSAPADNLCVRPSANRPSVVTSILSSRLLHLDSIAYSRTSQPLAERVVASPLTARISPALRHVERIESALSALARRDAASAKTLLMPLERLAPFAGGAHLPVQCELTYCFYKLRLLQGRQREASPIYTDYARMVFDLVHMQHVGIRRLVMEAGSQIKPYTDDVGVRLPARYRRAYNWMLTHIGQQDLSIKDIADVIGVTQRALQQTFKKCLGDSPTEVMRRLRMEHIHRALIQAKEGSEPIMDIANRFGVGNRTTLATSYRKYYAQAPSQTINSMSLKSGVPMSYGERSVATCR